MVRDGRQSTRRRRAFVAGGGLLAVVALIGGIVLSNGSHSSPGQASEPTATATTTTGSTDGSGAKTQLTGPTQTGQAQTGQTQTGQTQTGPKNLPAGLRLRAGHAVSTTQSIPAVNGKPLDQDRIKDILDLLPPMTTDPDQTTPFRWPTKSLTRPRTGTVVEVPFPPASSTDQPNQPTSPSGPLHVTRMQPQGQVAIAPFLSITFDQPMVPIATVGQSTDLQIPATITPKVDGTWSWIGTNTLRFAADTKDADRLPMATSYTVTVPAGTTSTTGGKLAETATFHFATPPPIVKAVTPTGKDLALTPVFVAVFDQNVDPKAVLAELAVTAGEKNWPVRRATDAEIAADDTAAAAVAALPAGRFVAFRPVAAFPADTGIQITVGTGTPSAEGPRTTTKAASFRGRTYPPMTLVRTSCQNSGCQAGGQIELSFSTPLDTDAFDSGSVKVSPELPGGADISAQGNTIVVQGATQPGVTYTVTVAAGLADLHDQQLTDSATGTARFSSAGVRLDQFPQLVTTVDPMVDNQTITVNTVNRREFRERVFRVGIEDWFTFRNFAEASMQSQSGLASVPDWPELVDRTVTIDDTQNRTVGTHLDLTDELSGTDGTHNVVVLIEPTTTEWKPDDDWQNRPTMTWVQATTLGVDALDDQTAMRVWVTDLRTGEPLPDTDIGLVGSSGTIGDTVMTSTDAHGIAAIELTSANKTAVLARRGDETALLAGWLGYGQWQKQNRTAQWLWFVDDDRQTYRPGETVSLKGWMRRQSGDTAAALSRPVPDTTVSYTVSDAYGVTLGSGRARLSALGGFDLKVDLPAGANLGTAQVVFRLGDASWGHSFEIADFRTPDFEVDTHGASAVPYLVGDDLTVAADATYYAGGPLGQAPVRWQVRTATASYAPPGWAGYTFGLWTPWWTATGGYRTGSRLGFYDGAPCCGSASPDDGSKVETFTGTTDGDGADYLQVQVGNLGKKYAGLPVTITTQASVTDANRQTIADSTDLLVHPAADYVGLATDDTFVMQGSDLVVRAIATDVDGVVAADRPVTIIAQRVLVNGWGMSDDSANDKTVGPAETCSVTSGAEPVTCTFHPTVAGTYRITATVTDAAGRASRSQLTRWVAGADGELDNSVHQQALTLVPDREEYQVGETAKVLVQSPILTGTGLATVLHNGITDTVTFPVANGSGVLSLPITEAEIPGVRVSIEVVGTAPRTESADDNDRIARPAYATGEIPLQVSTKSRELTVTAIPRDRTVKPGGSTKLDVSITDAQGSPVAGSEFQVVVADEAVLALGAQPLPDPLAAFYPELNNWVESVYGRAGIMLTDPAAAGHNAEQSVAETSSAAGSLAPGGFGYDTAAATPSAALAAGGNSRSAAVTTSVAERRNFTPLALFVPSATTDATGKATVDVPLPDSLTRYRVMVVAVAGDDRFGSAESSITAGLPLTVRPSGPAFLNFGDRFEFPVLVQNLSDATVTTDVVLQTRNLQVVGAAGQQVSIPAHERVEVRFDVRAAQAGTATVRVAAVGGTGPDAPADAATVTIPVYTPATTETVATYGTIDGGTVATQPVTTPKDVFDQFGGLQVSTSTTALSELTDAVDYVFDYPYDSSDALAAQIITIASMGDVLQDFSVPGLPSQAKLKALVNDDIDALVAMQHDDGGFGYWQGDDESDAFNSIQATQALVVAKQRGHSVPADTLARAEEYLAAIDHHMPAHATQQTKDTLTAYALNVRMAAGRRDAPSAKALVAKRGNALGLDAVAWLLPVVSDSDTRNALLLRVNNAAVDDAGAVTFTETVTDDAWTTLQSDRRTDGLVLDALLTVQPDSALAAKIVTGLLSARTSGRWDNIQENSVILLALRHYYDTFENTSPDLVARLWVGGRYAGDHDYSGHTTEQATVDVPTGQLMSATGADVTLQNDGTGRLYYRIGLQTAPKSLSLDPVDRGFVVARSYQAVDDPADVTRDADGVWHIKAGARVKVKLELVSRSARSHVALVDPLPAGLQSLNPALATTPKDLDPKAGNADTDAATPIWWSSTWYDHQNLRDDRAEAFAGWLQGGVYDYSYLARATTIGSFVAPPSRAEQIYAPETFGRGGTDTVVVDG